MKTELENILWSVKYEHKGLEQGYDKILSLFEKQIEECKDEITKYFVDCGDLLSQDIIQIIKNKIKE